MTMRKAEDIWAKALGGDEAAWDAWVRGDIDRRITYGSWDTDAVIFTGDEAWLFHDNAWYEQDPVYPGNEAGMMTAAEFAACFGALPRLPKAAFGGEQVLPKTTGHFCKVYRLPPDYFDHPTAYWEEMSWEEMSWEEAQKLGLKRRP
jgi:hypothetical protein